MASQMDVLKKQVHCSALLLVSVKSSLSLARLPLSLSVSLSLVSSPQLLLGVVLGSGLDCEGKLCICEEAQICIPSSCSLK